MVYEEFRTVQKGRLILALWGISFVSATFTGLKRRKEIRNAKKAAAAAASAATTADPNANADEHVKLTQKRALSLVVSEARKSPRVIKSALLVCASVLLRLAVSIKVSRKIGQMGSLLSQKRWRELLDAQISFALWTIPNSFLNSAVSWCESHLKLALEASISNTLTNELAGSESKLTAAQAELSRGAASIATADVEEISTQLASTLHSGFKPVAETLVLSGTLASLMGTKQLLTAYAYFFVAGSWSRLVTPSFKTSTALVAEKRGEYVANAQTMFSYSEEIELLNGKLAEKSRLESNLASVHVHARSLLNQVLIGSSLDSYAVRYMGILACLAMMSPALKESRESTRDPTEYFLTVLHLLVNLMSAFKDVGTSLRGVAAARGIAQRIVQLKSSFSTSTSEFIIERKRALPLETAKDSIRMSNVSLDSPVVLKSLSVDFKQNQNVLVRGPNGCGKTSLFRLLSGIWKPSNASEARIEFFVSQVSEHRSSFAYFLPQRAYVQRGASVQSALLYPHLSKDLFSEREMVDVLKKVGLTNLASDLEASVDGLSGGETQRLVAARMLLNKPVFAFLDEPTGSCSPEFEDVLLGECVRRGITVIHVSHKQRTQRELEESSVYAAVLELDADGNATWSAV